MKNFISTTLHTLVYHTRYSGAHVINKENVAEHSYFVTLLADLIAEDIEKTKKVEVDRLMILRMALYHDTEEAYTGDLITPVKNRSHDLKKEWDKLSSLMMQEGLQHDFKGQVHIKNYIMSVHTTYETYKHEKLENQIVKFSDGLQSVIYLLREIGFGNRHVNSILQNVIETMVSRFGKHELLGKYVTDLEKIVRASLAKQEHSPFHSSAVQSKGTDNRTEK